MYTESYLVGFVYAEEIQMVQESTIAIDEQSFYSLIGGLTGITLGLSAANLVDLISFIFKTVKAFLNDMSPDELFLTV